MKYALLVSRTLSNGKVTGWKNIGDYIQSLAAAQYMPQIDEYYDKTADDSGVDIVKMIMNGWFIWQPDKFPISERIIPLPISIHLSPVSSEKLLSIPNVLDWFKKHEPIGCRDKDTEKLLLSKGIDSYFSGCLTLTLGKKYKFNGERSGMVFVDPYLAKLQKELSFFDIMSSLMFGISHLKTLFMVFKKFKHHYCRGHFIWLKKIIYSSIFLKTYSNIFSLKELSKAEFYSHMVKVGDGSVLKTEKEKMIYSENLIKRYARANLIVTGRIHCALPCLGIETPVVFTIGHSLEEGAKTSKVGRLGGLIDFLNIVKIQKLKLSDNCIIPIENKKLYKKYAESLEEKCTKFMEDSELNEKKFEHINNNKDNSVNSEDLYAKS